MFFHTLFPCTTNRHLSDTHPQSGVRGAFIGDKTLSFPVPKSSLAVAVAPPLPGTLPCCTEAPMTVL